MQILDAMLYGYPNISLCSTYLTDTRPGVQQSKGLQHYTEDLAEL
jgi:hypothetical protein